MYVCLDVWTDTPSVLHRLFAGRTKGLKGDGAGMDVRVLPPGMRDSRFERSMGEALRQRNETLEMQEVSSAQTGEAQKISIARRQGGKACHNRGTTMCVPLPIGNVKDRLVFITAPKRSLYCRP